MPTGGYGANSGQCKVTALGMGEPQDTNSPPPHVRPATPTAAIPSSFANRPPESVEQGATSSGCISPEALQLTLCFG